MMEPSSLTWADYLGDGHFSSPGQWRAEFVNSDFVPAPDMKNKMNGGTRVIGPGVVAVPGFWGHGSCFRYSAEKDAWEEYDMKAKRITCVWNRYKESQPEEPDEEGTRTAAEETTVEESVEPSSISKLTSFLFGKREEPPTEEAPKEEEEAATLPVVAETEEEATEQPPPPPPAKRWFSREETEPAAPRAEEMHQRMAAWYNGPKNAALRSTWGAFPEPDEFQTWPGFVAVTNAFLDASPSNP